MGTLINNEPLCPCGGRNEYCDYCGGTGIIKQDYQRKALKKVADRVPKSKRKRKVKIEPPPPVPVKREHKTKPDNFDKWLKKLEKRSTDEFMSGQKPKNVEIKRQRFVTKKKK